MIGTPPQPNGPEKVAANVVECRELGAPRAQGLRIKLSLNNRRRRAGLCQQFALRIDDHRSARIGVVRIAADAIDGHHIRLILDRPRHDQGAPVLLASIRPTRSDREHLGSAQCRDSPELGESKVVADQRADREVDALADQDVIATAEVLHLTAVTEWVQFLVASDNLSARIHHDRAVSPLAVRASLGVSCLKPDAHSCREAARPGQGQVVHDHIEIEAEAGIAKFGQQDERPTRHLGVREHLLDEPMIRGLVLPGDIKLHGGKVHEASVSLWTMYRRWVALAGGLIIYTFVMMLIASVALFAIATEDWSDYDWSGLPGDLVALFADPEWWQWIGIPALVLVALQVVFLLPIISRSPPRDQRARSLTVSLCLGGAIAGVLSFMLGMIVITAIALLAEMMFESTTFDVDDLRWLWTVPVLMLVGGWCFWTLILLTYVRGIWADRVLGRLVGLLLSATLVELIVTIPLDIMVRRRTDCYCATPSFFTLCLAVLATLWLVGPGIVIALTSRRHRAWRVTHCGRCGYPKGPTPGAKCPECGYAWEAFQRHGAPADKK